MRKLTKEQVIAKFNKRHGMLYDYSKVDYTNCDTKISVICSTHGEFLVTPYEHWVGGGCPHVECRTTKTKQTKAERYGDPCYNNTPKNKETKEINHGNHRYNNPEKIRETSITRYGVDNPSKTTLAKEKISRANTTNAKSRMDKTRETNIIKYGVEWAITSTVVQDATSRYKRNVTTLPSGKTVKTQGYEHIAIKEILDSGIQEEELVLIAKPTIKYFWSSEDGYGDDKWHIYYPDIYIPHLNKIVEVKSTWTIDGKGTRPDWKSKNIAKIIYTKLAGYTMELMIYG